MPGHSVTLFGNKIFKDVIKIKQGQDNRRNSFCQQSALFWKNMPRKTFISKEEKQAPGFKAGRVNKLYHFMNAVIHIYIYVYIYNCTLGSRVHIQNMQDCCIGMYVYVYKNLF